MESLREININQTKMEEQIEKNKMQSERNMKKAWLVFFKILRPLNRYNKTGKNMPLMDLLLLKEFRTWQISKTIKTATNGTVNNWIISISTTIKIRIQLNYKESILSSSKIIIDKDNGKEINSFEFMKMPSVIKRIKKVVVKEGIP